MYLLQINRIVNVGRFTGIVNRYVEHYKAESLKHLLIKCNQVLQNESDEVSLNISFYKIQNHHVTEINHHSFNYEKLEELNPLLYFHTYGQKIEVDDD